MTDTDWARPQGSYWRTAWTVWGHTANRADRGYQGRIEDMARDFKDILHEATALPERDRATLAGLLIESLDPEPEADVEAAWSEEIRRRVAELDAGTVNTIPWEDGPQGTVRPAELTRLRVIDAGLRVECQHHVDAR